MAVKFYPENHKYESIDIFNPIEWKSASKLASMFKEPFDSEMHIKVSKNKKSKWYGLAPSEIQEHWKTENVRSTTLGTWYHEKEEAKLLGKTHDFRYGKELPIIRSIWEDGWKIAPDQKLTEGIYPEHLAYMSSVGVCGQFDEIIVCNGLVHNDDHKSNKDLKKPPFKNWDGTYKKMLPPLMHMEDSKLAEYAIQLSVGVYMVLRHNPQLQAGDLTLNHVTFEVSGENQFGYPIIQLDSNNEPIVKDVEKLKLPYLKREVELIFEVIKQERALKNV